MLQLQHQYMNQKELELAQLTQKWYAKLKKEGFKDLETSSGQLKLGADMYHQIIRGATAQQKKTHYESKERYYQLAGQFLYDHEFETPREQQIWELHSEGLSHSDIRKKLYRFKNTKETTIRVIIQKLSKIMLSQTDKYEQE